MVYPGKIWPVAMTIAPLSSCYLHMEGVGSVSPSSSASTFYLARVHLAIYWVSLGGEGG